MSTLRFTKMHGAGNDFVMLDLRDGRQEPSAAVLALLGDRHKGVGADQIISIESAVDTQAIARYRIWNSDGSTSQQCGNGARCVAAWIEREMGPRGRFWLESPSGLHEVHSLGEGQYRIDMGRPEFEPSAIPSNGFGDAALSYDVDGLRFSALSMGNPHAVIVVDDLAAADVAGVGARLQESEAFPESVNVGFAQVLDRSRIKLRVFERGVGETMACGSGACAAGVALIRLGLVDSPVAIELPGGELRIEWNGGGDAASTATVLMEGPTEFIYEGELLERA